MNQEQAKNCMKVLIELFPKAEIQREEMVTMINMLMHFNEPNAMEAIRRHRMVCSFPRPDFGEIIGDLRSKARSYKLMQEDLARKSEREKAESDEKERAEIMASLSPSELKDLMAQWRAEQPTLRRKDPNPETNVSFQVWVQERHRVQS